MCSLLAPGSGIEGVRAGRGDFVHAPHGPRGGAGHRDGAVQRDDGGIDAISRCVRTQSVRPSLDVEAATGLLEGGRAKARRARGVLEIEVEEALEYFVVDSDVMRQRSRLCIFSLLGARKEQGRFLAVRHVRRSGGGVQCTRGSEVTSGRL